MNHNRRIAVEYLLNLYRERLDFEDLKHELLFMSDSEVEETAYCEFCAPPDADDLDPLNYNHIDI